MITDEAHYIQRIYVYNYMPWIMYTYKGFHRSYNMQYVIIGFLPKKYILQKKPFFVVLYILTSKGSILYRLPNTIL